MLVIHSCLFYIFKFDTIYVYKLLLIILDKINYFMKRKKEGGFTLLELLIVIAIIAILSVALVLVLNPAETLKKARDSQRISDLSTLKTAIGLYMTSVSPAYIGGTVDNNLCKATPTTAWDSTAKISYSYTGTAITDTTLDGGSTAAFRQLSTPATAAVTSGTGWIPVNFGAIAGGSPISNIPVDPINTVAAIDGITSADLVYRYGCSVTPLAYEIDAQMESDAYKTTDDKRASDGGNNDSYYETGTNLSILGVGTDF